MKKALSLILSLLMIAAMIASCAKPVGPAGESITPGGNPESSTDAPNPTDTQPPEETKSDYAKAGIPEDLNYGDESVTVVYWERWDGMANEFDVTSDQLAGDPVDDAVYKRNLYTENLLGVDLNFVHLPLATGNLPELNDWCNRLENMMNDPATPVDLFASYSRCVAGATVRGLPQNLSVYSNLDFDREWWPSYIKDEFDIGGQMFFATGDISTYLLYSMYMIFFNENLVNTYGMEDPYQLYDSREWTIDKMIEMNSSVYQDMDETAGKSAGDMFSFTLEWWGSDAFIQGAGFKILENEKDGDNYIQVTEEFTSEKFGEFLEDLGDWCALNCVYNQRGYDGSAAAAFQEGRAIFHLGPAEVGMILQEVDYTYGILPPPMLDPGAQDYITTICEDYSIYAMGRNCKDGDRAAAVIQTMGYYANEYTTPAVFDITFKGKYAKTEKMMEMFDKIRGMISFDMGLLYQRQLNYINDWPTEAIRDNTEWKNKVSGIQLKGLEKKIKAINRDLDTLVHNG